MDNTGDISSMIGKIMSDPAFTEMVGRLKSSGSSVSGLSDVETSDDKSSENFQSRPAPEISDVMAAIGPMLSGIGADGGKHAQKLNESSRTENTEEHQRRFRKHDKAQAEKLLNALKPYLSKNRCEIIDKCVSVMQITDIVSAFGGIEGILKTAGI